MRVGNYTPFPLTVENITLEFYCGARKKISLGNFKELQKSEEQIIYLTETLHSQEAANLAGQVVNGPNRPRITYAIDFSNQIYRFQKNGNFEGFPVEVLNAYLCKKED